MSRACLALPLLTCLGLPLLLAPLVLASCGKARELPVMPKVADPRLQTVLTSVANQMFNCSIPGGAIAIVENGKVTESVGFGVEDEATNVGVSSKTRFQTLGLSKAILGATALRLVEQGSLDLTKPVTIYAPLTLSTGFDPTTISVANLFAQTSGLPDADVSSLTCGVGAGQLAAWFAGQPAQPLWTPPGQVWDYSQRGYAAAGWIVEQASSQSLEDAVAARVFGPAGMTTATYDPSVVLSGDYALGHSIDPGSGSLTQTYAPGQYDCEAFRAADGVYASVLDYAQFAATLYAGGGTMLTPASAQAFETGNTVDELYPGDQYAYGMYAHQGYKGLHLLRTSGSMHGFETALYMVPDQSFAVVVFFDGDNPSSQCGAGITAEVAIDQFLGLANVPGPNWMTPPSSWIPYVGTYVDPYVFGTITVALNGSQLTASAAGLGVVPLSQVSPTAFEATLDGHTETLIFAPGPRGPASWLVTRLGVAARQ